MSSMPLRVREARPLVHAITNYVTMDWVARGLLAAGARPVMARDRSEAAAVAGGASALLLNLGTWSPEVHAAMLEAGAAANREGVPVVLDPVGAGGLQTRTDAALELLGTVQVAAVRGNAGEIAALAGESGAVRGVDSGAVALKAAIAAARKLARRFKTVVAATGAVDLVTDGRRTLLVRAGHPLMAQIPGTGCLAGGLIAAALAVSSGVEAVAQALLWAGVAGEQAAEGAPSDGRAPTVTAREPFATEGAPRGAVRLPGPGSFAIAYLDALHAIEQLPAGRIAPPLQERLSLYVIVSGVTPLETVRQILAAGVGAIQFREKALPLPAQVEAARAMRELCREVGALFLVNDRVDLALAVGADGVHLGQEDLPVAQARRLLGPDAVIGGTCETPEEALIAQEQGADYLGTGPVYATLSKSDAGEPYGPAVVERVSGAVALPVVGIGGIGIGKAGPVIEAGACGVSVISAVVNASDPGMATRVLLEEVLTAKRRMEL